MDSWQFGPTIPSETYNPNVHRSFYICGGFFWFNENWTMTIPPGDGDIWYIRSSGHRVPCNANIYRFTTTGINENLDLQCRPLFSVSPSIFRTNTLVNLAITHESPVNISVYNILGQRVAVLLNRICQPGVYNIHWTGENLSSGIYFVRVDSRDIREVKKVVHIK
jgi:hypothetical protein